MNVLVTGADGFIGRGVTAALVNHTVWRSTIGEPTSDLGCQIDLSDRGSVAKALERSRPDAIINCAGIVTNDDKAKLNVSFTDNLLEAVIKSRLPLKRIIVIGSASEYGIVNHLPVSEEAPLRPNTTYGRSKMEETSLALKLGREYGLPVIVARLFNLIGPGMHPRMLIPNIVTQIEQMRKRERDSLEVARLDAKRDYVHVADVATAFRVILEHEPSDTVYNIGSRRATSNAELVDLILDECKLLDKPKVIETAKDPGPTYASQADISRITSQLGWKPSHSLAESIREIVHAEINR